MTYFSTCLCMTLLILVSGQKDESCARGQEEEARYLLYNVNMGEGFNLRRDVYVRISNLVRRLSEKHNWVLVLPPWGRFYHWSNTHPETYFPWKSFFDIPSLQKWIQVMEFEDFLKAQGSRVDSAYILQHYAEGWKDGKWEEKYDERPCIDRPAFQPHEGVWRGHVWGSQLVAQRFACVSVQGHASTLIQLLTKDAGSRVVYIGRAETVLHDEYGGKWYWQARRSMRFASHLREEAAVFRLKYLGSDDPQDGTELAPDWRDSKPRRGKAKGGPYVAVHLRRKDFVFASGKEVPSLKMAAEQIKHLLKKENLTSAFIATDAPHEEFAELQRFLPSAHLHHYTPEPLFLQQWGDGGVAIVDQIICSHARFFVGSYESTFSFRIQEEREILGFPEDTTFNRLCGENTKCEQPARWRIAY